MRSALRTSVQLALIGCLAASLAACATKKPAEVAVAPAMPAPTPAPAAPTPRPAAPAAPVAAAPAPAPNMGPTPGSMQDFVVNAGDRVFFDLDSYSIRGDAKGILDAQAAWLSRYPQVAIRIEGNADERGTREYNFALGARRANAVKDYLASKGVAATRIETVSYGKERPIDTSSTEDAWAKNRNGHTALTAGTRG
jgi:peptidoglycan-associated lipoprotein